MSITGIPEYDEGVQQSEVLYQQDCYHADPTRWVTSWPSENGEAANSKPALRAANVAHYRRCYRLALQFNPAMVGNWSFALQTMHEEP